MLKYLVIYAEAVRHILFAPNPFSLYMRKILLFFNSAEYVVVLQVSLLIFVRIIVVKPVLNGQDHTKDWFQVNMQE